MRADVEPDDVAAAESETVRDTDAVALAADDAVADTDGVESALALDVARPVAVSATKQAGCSGGSVSRSSAASGMPGVL